MWEKKPFPARPSPFVPLFPDMRTMAPGILVILSKVTHQGIPFVLPFSSHWIESSETPKKYQKTYPQILNTHPNITWYKKKFPLSYLSCSHYLIESSETFQSTKGKCNKSNPIEDQPHKLRIWNPRQICNEPRLRDRTQGESAKSENMCLS